ncbi:MAG: D-alanyl-alanine synthetase [Alphaproteobacteria bacterium]|nr:D-alanyl-alanine synthetase [Alphaproteobacteria bacterium]
MTELGVKSAAGPSEAAVLQGLRDGLDRLRDTLRIAVIYNGDRKAAGAVLHQTHNPRSEKSYRPVAQDIADGLKANGFRHVALLPDDLTLAQRLRDEAIDLAWLNTAGVQGYDAVAHTPSLLEMVGIPYVGHRPLLAVTLDNKQVFKRECGGLGLPTPEFMVWDGTWGTLNPEREAQFQSIFGDYAGPFVVKPVTGRASQHVHLVPDRASLLATVNEVYRHTLNQVLVERFVGGAEYCVAVGGRVVSKGGQLELLDAPFVFSALERMLEPDEKIFTSMDVRPITQDRTRLLSAADGAVYDELARLARRVHADFQLRALVRLDVRADHTGRLFILEANPKPDLKRPDGKQTSLVCVGLAAHGMSYEDLLLSQLIDRLKHYMRYRPAAVRHIADRLS